MLLYVGKPIIYILLRVIECAPYIANFMYPCYLNGVRTQKVRICPSGAARNNKLWEVSLTGHESGGVLLIPKGPPMDVIVVEVRPTLLGDARQLVITIIGGALGTALATAAVPLYYLVF
jgi:hypothetical protein